jgi:hypothetical protein
MGGASSLRISPIAVTVFSAKGCMSSLRVALTLLQPDEAQTRASDVVTRRVRGATVAFM